MGNKSNTTTAGLLALPELALKSLTAGAFVLAVCSTSGQAVIHVPATIRTNALSCSNCPAGNALLMPGLPFEPAIPDSPSLSTNFSGLDDNNTYTPPDTMGAVGTNRLMIMLNG